MTGRLTKRLEIFLFPSSFFLFGRVSLRITLGRIYFFFFDRSCFVIEFNNNYDATRV